MLQAKESMTHRDLSDTVFPKISSEANLHLFERATVIVSMMAIRMNMQYTDQCH